MSEYVASNGSGGVPEREIAEDPTAAGYHHLGDQLCAEGRLEDAIANYKRAIRLEGDNPSYYTRLGDAYLFAEDSAQALSHYRRALELNPGHGETHFCLGEVYRRF